MEIKSNKYHVAHPKTKNHINKYFHLVKFGDVDWFKTFECETMKGSQKLHQVIRYVSNREQLLRYEKAFAKEMVAYERTKLSSSILFLRLWFLLTTVFCHSCSELHVDIKIAYNMSKFCYKYLPN